MLQPSFRKEYPGAIAKWNLFTSTAINVCNSMTLSRLWSNLAPCTRENVCSRKTPTEYWIPHQPRLKNHAKHAPRACFWASSKISSKNANGLAVRSAHEKPTDFHKAHHTESLVMVCPNYRRANALVWIRQHQVPRHFVTDSRHRRIETAQSVST